MTMTLLAAGLVALGVLLATVAVSRRSNRNVKDLRQQLEMRYLDEAKPDPAETSSLLARSGVAAERALAGTSLLRRLAGTIERSSWKVSPGELAIISVGGALLAVVLGLGLGFPLLAVPVLPIVALVLPLLLCSASVSKRTRRFEQQFPDILDLMGASLEAGAGVPQALELVVAEADDPAADEFARVLAQTQLGVPWVQSLLSLSDRLNSRDVQWTVQAIVVQQRTGGRLAEVLRIVAETMRSREEIRRELAALTAEGRLSAYILAGLPVAFAFFLEVAQPAYIRPLFTTALGLILVIVGSVIVVGSYFVMLKIIKIEV